jgi:formate-nitrite transporter family protein
LADLTPPLSAEDHIEGPERAELELVMYGDFQCPYTQAAYRNIGRIRDQLAGRLLFGFRHFPLREVHPDAQVAAEAAEAAAAQGAFWQMHDRLFEARGVLGREDLIAYATELGLDADRVASELDASTHAARVQRDLDGGVAGGVKGTPGLFVGGRFYGGSYEGSSLIAALEVREGAP